MLVAVGSTLAFLPLGVYLDSLVVLPPFSMDGGCVVAAGPSVVPLLSLCGVDWWVVLFLFPPSGVLLLLRASTVMCCSVVYSNPGWLFDFYPSFSLDGMDMPLLKVPPYGVGHA